MIVIWYDNFLVLSEDKEVVEEWKAHFEGRAKKCNAQWKTSEENRQVSESVEFLGLGSSTAQKVGNGSTRIPRNGMTPFP